MMNTPTKLRLSVFLSLIFISTYSLAIRFEPVQYLSNAGELFYAEIKYHHVQPETPLELSLASAEELSSFGVAIPNPPRLNIYQRKIGDGRQGVIVLTALQPINSNQLNLFIKIKVGNSIHYQQFKSDLVTLGTSPHSTIDEQSFVPLSVANESEISLNTLAAPTDQSKPVIALFEPLSPTEVSSIANLATSSADLPSHPDQPTIQARHDVLQHDIPTKRHQIQSEISNPTADLDNNIQTAPQRYLVRSNESLSKIAQRIAIKTHQNTDTVMRELKRNNQHAFIQGDPDRLRKGAMLHFFMPEKTTDTITRPPIEIRSATTEYP